MLLCAGMTSVTERLDQPVDTVPDLFFTVAVNRKILSEELTKKFNPLVVKVHSATNMPTEPIHYELLRARLVAACRYGC